MDAARFGDFPKDCPYEEGTAEASEWRSGYSDIGERFRGTATRLELAKALGIEVQFASFRAERMLDAQRLYRRFVEAFGCR